MESVFSLLLTYSIISACAATVDVDVDVCSFFERLLIDIESREGRRGCEWRCRAVCRRGNVSGEGIASGIRGSDLTYDPCCESFSGTRVSSELNDVREVTVSSEDDEDNEVSFGSEFSSSPSDSAFSTSVASSIVIRSLMVSQGELSSFDADVDCMAEADDEVAVGQYEH